MYDTIIVGAGSAGCVLADRLSASGDRQVLLLEAGGPDKQREIPVPIAFSKLFKTDCDWDYTTNPEPNLDRRELYWPRGRVLGGSSSINAMVYIRGNRRDYDTWAALGNEGWGFKDVLPFFKRSENQVRGESDYHGVGGPLHVQDPRDPHVLSLTFVEAAVAAGLPANADFNGTEQDGVGLYQLTQKRGRRWSTANAFLAPARKRPNLTVRTHALVTRVTIESGHVTGVDVVDRRNAGAVEHFAAPEVVVSAGAVNSPQLLLLSGIGPADHLREHAIDVALDLRGVGRGLQDHPAAGVVYACTSPVTHKTADTFGNLLRYLFLKKGPFTSNVAESGGFVKTRAGTDRPDIQFHVAPSFYEDHGLTEPEGHGFTIGPTLVQPLSRGHVELRSADPTDAPNIQPNYLDEPADMASLVAGVKIAREVAQTAPYDPWRGEEIWPGPDVVEDAQIEAFLRARSEGLYHPVGTCRMGRDEDAVVDTQLRVRGVEGLRVVDASIMPTIVGGNTNAPTIMIAEKAAEMMKG